MSPGISHDVVDDGFPDNHSFDDDLHDNEPDDSPSDKQVILMERKTRQTRTI